MKRVTFFIGLFSLILLSGVSALELSHMAAPVFGFSYIETANRDIYKFQSAGVNYYLKSGDELGYFISTTIVTPYLGKQQHFDFSEGEPEDSDWQNLWGFYNLPFGFDLLIGGASTFFSQFNVKSQQRDTMQFDGGLGFHLNGVFLNHTKYELRSFSSLTFGLGVDVRMSMQADENLYLGWMINGNFDFLDLLHNENKMISYFGLNTGFVIGYKTGRSK